MTTEETIKTLRSIDEYFAAEGCSYDDSFYRTALREAIRRLTPTEPPPGHKVVRIAVVMDSNFHEMVLFTDKSADAEVLQDCRDDFEGTPTNAAVIVAAIPPVTVPEVRAEVEHV